MSRIVLTTIGSLGDLHPKLALIDSISRCRRTADRVVKELRIILEDPTYASTAATIANNIRSADGVKIACDAIEQQLRN